MHLRYQYAAVAVDESPSLSNLTSTLRSNNPDASSKSSRVLWATSAMSVRAGRLVGVRLVGHTVEVAIVKQGTDRLQWVEAEGLLTDFEIEKWLRTSKFTP